MHRAKQVLDLSMSFYRAPGSRGPEPRCTKRRSEISLLTIRPVHSSDSDLSPSENSVASDTCGSDVDHSFQAMIGLHVLKKYPKHFQDNG